MARPLPPFRRRQTELTDPRALRALAHPLRMRLLGLLRFEGPLTATEAGRHLDQSPANVSFHLRQLAKWGLVEEAGGGTGRQRPWQATSYYIGWPDVTESPEMAEAEQELARFIGRHQFASLMRWLEAKPQEPPRWQEAAAFDDTQMYLTAEELAELTARMRQLAEEFTRRTLSGEPPPEGSRLVTAMLYAFPHIAPGDDA
ncbi:MAG: winged helix-turn-helix domain-containing protein [Gaiellales bacterium]